MTKFILTNKFTHNMKPKEFIEKYGLETGWKAKYQNDFLQDMTSELLAFLEYNKAENNIKGFDNAVKVIRMKWDAISNKNTSWVAGKTLVILFRYHDC